MAMAKRKRGRQRLFNREVLDAYAIPVLRVRMGPGEAVWRYTVTVPLEEVTPTKCQKATSEDLYNLYQMLVEHFGGLARLPDSPGFGLRDPSDPPEAAEMNFNTYFVVLTSPVLEADAYF